MKRSGISRRTSLRASSTPMTRGGTLKPRGETWRKKRARYQAYLRSPEWKAKRRMAIRAAGHQCQQWRAEAGQSWRCREVTRLEVHHQTYARFGGAELLEDLLVLCRACHRRHHAAEGKRSA